MTSFSYWTFGVLCGVVSVWGAEQILGVLMASVVASMMRGIVHP